MIAAADLVTLNELVDVQRSARQAREQLADQLALKVASVQRRGPPSPLR